MPITPLVFVILGAHSFILMAAAMAFGLPRGIAAVFACAFVELSFYYRRNLGQRFRDFKLRLRSVESRRYADRCLIWFLCCGGSVLCVGLAIRLEKREPASERALPLQVNGEHDLRDFTLDTDTASAIGVEKQALADVLKRSGEFSDDANDDADKEAQAYIDALLLNPQAAAKVVETGEKDLALSRFQRANGISDAIAEAAVKEWILTHNRDKSLLTADWDYNLSEVEAICRRMKREGY